MNGFLFWVLLRTLPACDGSNMVGCSSPATGDGRETAFVLVDGQPVWAGEPLSDAALLDALGTVLAAVLVVVLVAVWVVGSVRLVRAQLRPLPVVPLTSVPDVVPPSWPAYAPASVPTGRAA